MPRTTRLLHAGASAWLVALLLGGTAALAAPSVDAAAVAVTPGDAPIAWEALSEADRAALVDPVRERWERATPAQQQRYLERARFWASLTPEQKQQARRGMRRWSDADPETRARHLDAWQRLMENPRPSRPGHDTRPDRFDTPRDPVPGGGG